MSLEDSKEKQDLSKKDFMHYKAPTNYLNSLFLREFISERDKKIIEGNIDTMSRMNPIIISLVYNIAIEYGLNQNSSDKQFEDSVINAFENIQKGNSLDIKISQILKENYDNSLLLKLKSQMIVYWRNIKTILFSERLF